MDQPLHDESNGIPISCEVIVKTRRRIKNPNPKWYKHLLKCLDEERHGHMLSYIDSNKKKFKVVFTDKKNKKKWRTVDISLFKDLDKHIGYVFNRRRSEEKFEEGVKIRFKSNMSRCVEKKYIKEIGKTTTEKCKTEKMYEILWRPDESSVGESSSDGSMSKNFRKSYKKVLKKNDKKNNLSRNFQEKTARIESVPQVDNHENMNFAAIPKMDNHENVNFAAIPKMDNHENVNFETIPEMGNHENMIFTTIPQVGNHENMIYTTIPQVGNHENMIYTTIPQVGNHENMIFTTISQMGNHENMIFTTISQIGNHENMILTTIPQVGNHENVIIESVFQMGNHKIEEFKSMSIEDNGKNEISGFENLIFENQDGEMHFANVHQGVAIPQHTYEEKHEKSYSYYPCVSANSQSSIYEASVDDKGKKIWENSDVSTNMRLEETNLDLSNDGVFENQGNQSSLYNGKYVVEEDGYLEEPECFTLRSDPYLYGGGQYQSDFF